VQYLDETSRTLETCAFQHNVTFMLERIDARRCGARRRRIELASVAAVRPSCDYPMPARGLGSRPSGVALLLLLQRCCSLSRSRPAPSSRRDEARRSWQWSAARWGGSARCDATTGDGVQWGRRMSGPKTPSHAAMGG
jgi:hypothetical protein